MGKALSALSHPVNGCMTTALTLLEVRKTMGLSELILPKLDPCCKSSVQAACTKNVG